MIDRREGVTNKYRHTVLILIILVLLLFHGAHLLYPHHQKSTLKDDTMSYITDKGYNIESDIEEPSIINVGLDEPTYAVVVNQTSLIFTCIGKV